MRLGMRMEAPKPRKRASKPARIVVIKSEAAYASAVPARKGRA